MDLPPFTTIRLVSPLRENWRTDCVIFYLHKRILFFFTNIWNEKLDVRPNYVYSIQKYAIYLALPNLIYPSPLHNIPFTIAESKYFRNNSFAKCWDDSFQISREHSRGVSQRTLLRWVPSAFQWWRYMVSKLDTSPIIRKIF